MLQDNLFLTSSQSDKNKFIESVNKVADIISNSYNSKKAFSGITPEELKKKVKGVELLPEDGIGFEKVLERIENLVLPNMLKVSSTDYMAHLHSPPLMESILSELILTSSNQSMDSWDQAPVATEIEVDVVNQLCKLYNLPEKADGIFTSGGTQSNLMGLTLARDWYCNEVLKHDVKKLGLPSGYNNLRIYTSSISHFSVEKSAHLLGLGYNSVVKVPVTSSQKMDTNALSKLISDDLDKGYLPMAVIATVGTTDYGSIDNLSLISDLCIKFGMWLHADAAYGSGLVLSETAVNRISELKNVIL